MVMIIVITFPSVSPSSYRSFGGRLGKGLSLRNLEGYLGSSFYMMLRGQAHQRSLSSNFLMNINRINYSDRKYKYV